MCLYPRFIKNKRYFALNNGTKYRKNYTNEICEDYRKLYVPIGCGNCIECRMQKAREWQTRLHEELRTQNYAYFTTLTFSNEALEDLMQKYEVGETNEVAGIAVRLFLERWRKIHGKSLRHWLITELGHENTERIHLHGILFPNEPLTNDKLTHFWKYGRTDTGKYCNERSINYIVKYVTKIDEQHKTFKARIFCSAGLGANYITNFEKRVHRYIKGQTNETYKLPNGNKIALPIYYRNKLWTQEERDNLWTDRLDKQKRYIRGIEIDISKSDEQYYKVLEEQQRDNIKLGYGSTDEKWNKESYNITHKMLQKAKK